MAKGLAVLCDVGGGAVGVDPELEGARVDEHVDGLRVGGVGADGYCLSC